VGEQGLEFVPPLETVQNLLIEPKEQFADLSHPSALTAILLPITIKMNGPANRCERLAGL
jgi:hypothetical protein